MRHLAALLDPSLSDSGFDEFPLPLAVAAPNGKVERGNRHFQARFGDTPATVLEAEEPHGTWAGWKPVQLFFASDATSQVRAHALEIGDQRLVLVDADRDDAWLAELERVRLRVRELERASATDHLTGAWNRSHFDTVVSIEVERSRQTAAPLTLVLLDIDHFKDINDTFGHATGDAVLRSLVRLLRANMRASDVLFRWGGEEFVVLAASAGYRKAAVLAENLRAAVESFSFSVGRKVTVSAGVAEWLPGEALDTWFERLDTSLYRAKNTGRNRVEVDRRGLSDLARTAESVVHLQWHEAYESGHPTIDSDHRELFDLANVLLQRAGAAVEGPEAIAALETLLDHIRVHFAQEEQILEERNYSHLTEHRRAHAGLLKRAAVLRERHIQGLASLGDLVEFLAQDVVARHMLSVDRAFFPLFSAN